MKNSKERITYLVIAVFAFAVATCGLVEGFSTRQWQMVLLGVVPLILIGGAILSLARQKSSS